MQLHVQRGLNIHVPFIHVELFNQKVCVTETSCLHILMQCCKGFHYPHSIGIVHYDIKGDNTCILIAKVNLGEWQLKIIDFNKVCETKTATITECPVSERARLKSCHKCIDPALYDGQYMPLVQLQMFIAHLVLILVKLLKQRNQNKLTNLF